MSQKQTDRVVIEAPKFGLGSVKIEGTAPYMQHKFSEKAKRMMMDKHRAGSQSRKGQKREPRDFEADYKQAMYVSREGWNGIPASAFRNAMISACRIVGFKMTIAKLSVFVDADGFDVDDGTPLVKIHGKPRVHEGLVRNETGVADIRWRPMWETWNATLNLRWDEAQFSLQDIANLLMRAGQQVGIGEGRPDSKNSAGIGLGLFKVSA
jgi:hypothetical protein